MDAQTVDPARSRIVLVGTPGYDDPKLFDVPAIANNLTDFAAVLTDPDLGGFDPAHCTVAPPRAGVAQIGEILVRAAAEAQDLLLFYYSGHGLLSWRRSELYLGLAQIARAIVEIAPERARLLVHEAERIARTIADEVFRSQALAQIADTTAERNLEQAEIIAITITDEASRSWALARVAGAAAGTDPIRAEQVARTVSSRADRAQALALIAEATLDTDPERARRLIQEAEYDARAAPREVDRAQALANVARTMAGIDLERAQGLTREAERIARTLTSEAVQAQALLGIVDGLLGDPT